MTLDITVRGSAEQHHPAERAIVSLAAVVDGHDKQDVFTAAVDIQEPLTGQLKELVGLHAVQTWSSDQVRVFSHRPWDGEGRRGEAVHLPEAAGVHTERSLADGLDDDLVACVVRAASGASP